MTCGLESDRLLGRYEHCWYGNGEGVKNRTALQPTFSQPMAKKQQQDEEGESLHNEHGRH